MPRTPALVLPALLTATLILTSCGDPAERPATWAYIHPAIVQPSCATSSCHSALAETASLRLDDEGQAYEALLERQFVLPGDPSSPLLFVLRGEEVDRMPPDAPLPRGDVRLIRAWIEAGAPR